MKKRNLLFFILVLNCVISYSQIKGTCIDSFGEPIPYVNISVLGKNYGTVSNEKGEFSFSTKDITNLDFLHFSHLNYKEEKRQVNSLDKAIVLIENITNLEEIILVNRKYKIKEIGAIKKRDVVILYSGIKGLGNEIGKVIELKKNKEYDLLKCYFRIANLGFKEIKVRINFYEFKNNIISKTPLNKRDIIKKIDKKGDVVVDLEPYNLNFNSAFLVAIEWIDYKFDKNQTKINLVEYSSNVFKGPFYYRGNKKSEWKNRKLKYNIGLGVSILAKIYKK